MYAIHWVQRADTQWAGQSTDESVTSSQFVLHCDSDLKYFLYKGKAKKACIMANLKVMNPVTTKISAKQEK